MLVFYLFPSLLPLLEQAAWNDRLWSWEQQSTPCLIGKHKNDDDDDDDDEYNDDDDDEIINDDDGDDRRR